MDQSTEKEQESCPPESPDTSGPSIICDDVSWDKLYRTTKQEQQNSGLIQVIILETADNENQEALQPEHGGLQVGVEQEFFVNPWKVNIGNGTSSDFRISSVALHQNIDTWETVTEDNHIMLSGGGSPLIVDNVHCAPSAFRDTDREDGGSSPGDNHVVDLPRTSPGSSGSQVGVSKDHEENTEGLEGDEPPESSIPLLEEDHLDFECPICTERYDASNHKQSLLNCSHVFCDNCIKTMLNKANRANLGRVACPLCRQTTPMLEWEIRKMQDQMMDSGGVSIQQDYVSAQPVVRRPGLCGSLEYRFQKRFQTGRLVIFPPCIRYPHRLMDRLNRLERRCRCLYLCAVVFFLFAEFFCFTFLFLPILIFILMIVIGK